MNRLRRAAFAPIQSLRDRNPSLLVALSAGLGYVLFAGLWIEFSSALADDIARGTYELWWFERVKGTAFIVVMAVVVATLTYAVHRQGMQSKRAQQRRRRDPLTGLMSRPVAMAALRKRLAEASEAGSTTGVMLLDIVRLGRINHALGRAAGDIVIRLVGQRLLRAVGGDHLVARLENNSFLVGLPPGFGVDGALALARRVQSQFRAPVTVRGQEVKVDLYGGLAIAPDHGTTAFELVDAAMRARERCRAQGRDLCIAAPGDRLGSRAALALEADLRRAIQHREFSLVFQPQVELERFEMAGSEALVRWHHPTRGLVFPGEFIPLAEQLRLIPGITHQVLDDAMARWAEWRRHGLRTVPVSVNLSPLDLNNDHMVGFIRALLARHEMPARYLVLEITEGWLMDDPQRALSILEQLRAFGVRIAIDDFGTGYSSLSQLMHFPVDEVKIDRSFVAGADADPKKRTLLQAIEHMAASLGAQTIAEGAQTFGELAVLKRIGFSQVQGYVIAAPLPAEAYAQAYLQPGTLAEFEAARQSLNKLTSPPTALDHNKAR
ncbi:MAG TPA: bifunctional diguanylate cyclase/phosphodiesterase [Gammaproteobacteria bacterium]|nr:bifunctional diguanylate cyclase/phosphodiesterase [Gammaproteobacteria bacterium]